MSRYQRHSLIDWFDQSMVKEAKVIVVGAGAVGNEVLKNLSLLGIGNILIIDFDRIEEHNLTRSILFRGKDIGNYKAEVAAAACNNIDPNISIIAKTSHLWNDLTLNEIAEADVVISCVDNYEARMQLNKLCLIAGTDFINTGIDSRSISVELFPFSKEHDPPCYECNFPLSAYENLQKRYSCGYLKKISFEEKKIPTTTITSSVAGAIAVSIVMNRVNKHEHSIAQSMKYYQDTVTLNNTTSIYTKNNNCPICSRYEPKLERYLVKRNIPIKSVLPLSNFQKIDIVLSEPILSTGKCEICKKEYEYYDSVMNLDDSVTYCSDCRRNSIKIDFLERMTLKDFEKAFRGKNILCKFIKCYFDNKQIILEMED